MEGVKAVRSRAIGTAAVLLVLLMAAPAMAKGINRAHLSGPGLPGDGVTLIRAKGITQVGLVAPTKAALSALGVRPSDLGTAYRARYRMDYAPRHVLRQVVYPYAEGGPITFTPRGQHIGQDYESFRGGWHKASPRLLTLLVRHGFPDSDPAAPDEVVFGADGGGSPLPVGPFSPTSFAGAGWRLTVLAVLALVVGSAVFVRIRRRTTAK